MPKQIYALKNIKYNPASIVFVQATDVHNALETAHMYNYCDDPNDATVNFFEWCAWKVESIISLGFNINEHTEVVE